MKFPNVEKERRKEGKSTCHGEQRELRQKNEKRRSQCSRRETEERGNRTPSGKKKLGTNHNNMK